MKKVLLQSIFLISFPIVLCGQVWEGHNADFPTNLFGGSTYAIDENVAWCWGFERNSSGYDTYANNAISVTSDAGLTWKNIVLPTDDSCYISSISALNDQIAWLTYVKAVNGLDAGNFVWKTIDGGQSWDIVDVTVNVFVDFIFMWNEDEGLIVGDPDTDGFEIYNTVDGGASWERIQDNTVPLNGEVIWADNYGVKGNQLWFATSKGRIFHTMDKGLTWEVWPTPFGGFDGGNMGVSDDGDVYLSFYQYVPNFGREDCFLFRRNAVDGQWVNITETNHNYFMYDIKPIPGSNIVMSTISNGHLTRISYDKGDTWTVIDDKSSTSYFDFFSPEVGYTSHFNPTAFHVPTLVYRYVGSPLTGLIKQTPLLDVDLCISPNPVSDVVVISLKTESSGDFWILLNSISGELLDKKIITQCSEFNSSLDLSDLSTGTYMITIANEYGIKTEKLVKI